MDKIKRYCLDSIMAWITIKRMLLDSDEAEIAKVNPWHQIEKLIEINKWDYF